MSEQNKIDEIKAMHAASTPEWYDYLKHDAYEYITYLLQEITTLKTNLEYWEPMANRLADSVEKLQGEVEFWKQAADNQKDNNMKLISVIHEKDEKMREAINIWETATPEDDFDDIMHAVIDELKDSLAL